jgi:hypothetical protein
VRPLVAGEAGIVGAPLPFFFPLPFLRPLPFTGLVVKPFVGFTPLPFRRFPFLISKEIRNQDFIVVEIKVSKYKLT